MEIAVIQTGGKQYKVAAGDLIKVERIIKTAGTGTSIPEEHKEGDKIVFDEVLLMDNGKDTTLGTPFIDKAKVTGTIVKIGRLPKVTIIKYKQKSRYFKKNGHRQPFFQIKIDALK